MAKVYKKKSGLNVVSGLVKSIDLAQNGAKRVVITVSEKNPQTKKWEDKDIAATSNVVDDGVVVGAVVTAAGYLWGASNIMASYISAGPHVETIDEVEIVSGLVQKAVYKSEINEDGTPKLTRNGTPRKPHFDISVMVPDEEGHRVIHITKVYNFSKSEEGQLSNIEKMQKRFADFKDKDSTPIECTIVTVPGNLRSWDSEYNGKIYHNFCCDHMGLQSLDLNYLFEKDTPVRNEPTHVAEPAPMPSLNPAAQAPVGSMNPPVQTPPVYGGVRVPDIEDPDVFV